MIITWLVAGFITMSISQPLIGHNINNILEQFTPFNIRVIPFAYFLLTIIMSFISLNYGQEINETIIKKLILYRLQIRESDHLSSEYYEDLLSYWKHYTKQFQMQVINNNELSAELLDFEIKNHILKTSTLWNFARAFFSIISHISVYLLSFLILIDINWILICCFSLITPLLLYIHFYFSGFFSRQKVETSSFIIKLISPWEFHDTINTY